ncbi:competence protein CoiA [Pseudoxanthomonas gei]|uniref:Competence protein CoiA n=1 Tax=Pseudoxanthomonas gei TaxID=1383030 RepID=A0ABX0A734_9GAMM|nr:competence protein CoiA family protein [Pseudoxanthomonas gei]NDK37333.1 competence protein CoiA [Pseudoxanthomonas gei]
MDLTLVPFGLHEASNQLVDVAEVQRGKASGCICPSCRAPLVAKHGEVNQWHFAHLTRGTFTRTHNECHFSFFVSVRMMARQVIGQSMQIDLPTWTDKVSYQTSDYSRPRERKFLVTEARTVTLTNVEVERDFAGVPVDLRGLIGEFRFVIYFLHPGRPLPEALQSEQMEERKCGVIAIDLSGLQPLFSEAKLKGETYAALLERFIAHDLRSKRWVFHPRYKKARESALEQLSRYVSDTAVIPMTMPFKTQAGEVKKFECVICPFAWDSNDAGLPACPKCNSHLYVRTM